MKRLFIFGCSYTSYSWPTWANMLELQFDHVENWALAGIGNRAIAERVAEADARNQFTKDDIVIVQWSSHIRNDWWHQESMPERTVGWKTYGSIFNYHNIKLYDKKWVDTFFYEPAYFMHTLNHVSLTQGLLQASGCEWYMTSMSDLRNMGSDMRESEFYGEKTDLTNNYKDTDDKLAWKILPDLRVYEPTIWDRYADNWLTPFETFCQSCPELTYKFTDSKGAPNFLDLHPSPSQHLMWLESELKDKLNLSTTMIDDARELVVGIDKVHAKYQFDKKAFEFALGKKNGFPQSADKIKWPGRGLGF